MENSGTENPETGFKSPRAEDWRCKLVLTSGSHRSDFSYPSDRSVQELTGQTVQLAWDTHHLHDMGLVMIPSNALLFRSEGPSVGVVFPDGKVEVRKSRSIEILETGCRSPKGLPKRIK